MPRKSEDIHVGSSLLSFDNLATVINGFTEATGLSRYTLYMQDYGVPVGFRMALAHPSCIEALIVQDGVAHNEGLAANWAARRALGGSTCSRSRGHKNLLSLATTRIGDDPNVELYDPDLWTDEFAFLSQPVSKKQEVTERHLRPWSATTPNCLN